MTKGQRAMAVAMIYPEPEKAHRGKRTEAGKVLETKGFSPALLSQARPVLAYSQPLCGHCSKALRPDKAP